MNSPELLPSMIKIFSALAIVVGMMIASIYLAKKVMRKAGGKIGEEELIKIVATRYVGPKSNVMIIDVLGKLLVVGLTNNQMSLLTRIDDDQSLDWLKTVQGGVHKPSLFSDQLAFYKSRLLSMCSSGDKNGRENA
jgi:flagellar protein FliO/FliZ